MHLEYLNIKYKKIIYYSLIHPYLTYCINVWSSAYWKNLKTLCTTQKRSVRTLFATAQQPNLRDIFINQKIFPLDKLIDQWEGILVYKVINGTYLLNNFLNHGEVRHQIQLWNIGDLRIPLYEQHILNTLFAIEPSIRGMAYQVTCAAHHSVFSRINYDCFICL